jgi:hypothetical protein
MQCVREYDSYFVCKPDVTDKLRFTSYQKMFCSYLHGCIWSCRWSYWWILAYERDHIPWFDVQVLQTHDIAVFDEVYLDDMARLLSISEARGFQGCLEAQLVCIGSGRTILLHGRDSIVVMHMDALRFLRLLHHTIYGFGTLSSAWQVQQWQQHAPALSIIL